MSQCLPEQEQSEQRMEIIENTYIKMTYRTSAQAELSHVANW